jgi:hypothetical protein
MSANSLSELVNRMQSLLNNKQLTVAFGGGISNPEIGIASLLEQKVGRKLVAEHQDYALSAAKFGLTSK